MTVPLPKLPGHSIPYHFTDAESAAFLQRNTSVETGNVSLVNYLRTGVPQWGVIVNELSGEILVYRSGFGQKVHVVDVTNMRIAKSVQQAPYESPGSSLFVNLREDFQAVFGWTLTALQWLAIAAVAIAIIHWQWTRKS